MGSTRPTQTNTSDSVITGAADCARRAVVVTGGGPLAPTAVAALRVAEETEHDRGGHDGGGAGRCYVVAADSGLDHALAAGLRPDLLVGDLDSISPAGLAWAEANCAVQRHAPDKSATDTELAITTAVGDHDRPEPDELILIAGAGDRLDHLLATIGAAARAAADHPDVAVRAWIDTTQLHYVTPAAARELQLPAGTTFSLLALDGAATGVHIAGARWPLADATLAALSGLGVSNVAVATPVTVTVATGVVAVVIPADDTASGTASRPSPFRPTNPTGGPR